MSAAARSPLRTVTAVYPGPTHPRRGHFIERIHTELSGAFTSEVVAPRVFRKDPVAEVRDGVSVTRFEYASRDALPKSGLSPWQIWRYLQGATRCVARRWPRGDGARGGLVLGHWILPTGWVAARVARRLGLPLVLYAHGSDLHTLGRRLPGRLVVGRVLREAHSVFVASSELGRIVTELSGRRDSEVLPVGIDPIFREPGGARPEIPPLRILYVGDLLEAKGVGALIEAMRILEQRGEPVELQIAGEGPLREAVVAAGDEARVAYLGELDAPGVRAAMARSHLLVHPSRREGTPVVVQEALAMRLPVLAPPVGGVPDLFDERAGWGRLGAAPGATELADRLAEIDPAALARTADAMGENEVESLFQDSRVRRLRVRLEEISLSPRAEAPC